MSVYVTETRAEIEARVRKQVRGNFKKEAPADGLHQFVVTGTTVLENPSRGDKDGNGAGCPTLAIRVAPLAVEDDIRTVQPSMETTIWPTLPLRNSAIEGHTVDSKTENKWTNQISALFPNLVPFVPAKTASGEWDNTPETKAARNEARVEAILIANQIINGETSLVDMTFYAITKKREDGDGYFVNDMRSELKPGEKFADVK